MFHSLHTTLARFFHRKHTNCLRSEDHYDDKKCLFLIPAVNTTDDEPFEPWPGIEADFLISEVNADSPGSAEDEEFVELWHPSGRRTSLSDIWVLLINGNNGKIYREIELHGHYTDNYGYFLVSCSSCDVWHLHCKVKSL